MTKDGVVELIQKLLMKTVNKGCTEAEAESALKKAQQLMIEYNVSMAEVNEKEVHKKNWVDETGWEGNGLPWDMRYVCTIVDDFFFVKVVIRRGYRGSNTSIQLFGDKENVEVAKRILIFLSRVYRDLWQQYRKAHPYIGHKSRTYYSGLTAGLSNKLHAERKVIQEKQKNALIVISNQLDVAHKERYPNLLMMNSTPIYGSSIHEDGKRDGKDINIRKAVQSGQTRGLLT